MGSPLNTDKKNAEPETDFLTPLENRISHDLEMLQFSARQTLLSLLTGICFSIFGMGLLLVSSSFLLYGLSVGLGKTLGSESWLGFVIIGGAIILAGLLFNLLKPARKKAPPFSISFRVKKWMSENPILTTTAVALSGFVVSFKFMSKQKSKAVAHTEKTSPSKNNSLKSNFVTLLIEFVTPIFQYMISDFILSSKKIEHENAIQEAQEKMDAEGGNQGIPSA